MMTPGTSSRPLAEGREINKFTQDQLKSAEAQRMARDRAKQYRGLGEGIGRPLYDFGSGPLPVMCLRKAPVSGSANNNAGSKTRSSTGIPRAEVVVRRSKLRA